MIRKVLLSTVALVAIGGTALAADLPSRRAPPVYVAPVPVFTWTGFYIGGDIGLAFGRESARIPGIAGANASGRPNGIIGGGHVGYNFSSQSLPVLGALGGGAGPLGGGLVVGIEADISALDYRSNPPLGNVSAGRNDIQGSARGRVGIAVDRALFFATGGAAFAEFRNEYRLPGVLGGIQTLNRTRVGWTVGGGMEYAITTQWSLRAQYLYSDFGSYREFVVGGLIPVDRRNTIQRAQVGFSYKFDTPVAPVVARY